MIYIWPRRKWDQWPILLTIYAGNLQVQSRNIGYFQVRYDSRVINYNCRGFIRLATDVAELTESFAFLASGQNFGLCAWDSNLGRQDGSADESTELWRHPLNYHSYDVITVHKHYPATFLHSQTLLLFLHFESR